MRTAPGPSSGSTLGLPQAVFMDRTNKVIPTFHDHHPHRLWGSGRDVCVYLIRNWKLTFICVWFVYSIPYYHRFSNFLVSFAQKRSHKDLKAMSKDISVISGKFSREITFYCTQEITLLHTETLLLQSSRICN